MAGCLAVGSLQLAVSYGLHYDAAVGDSAWRIKTNSFRVTRSNIVGPLEWVVHLAAFSWWAQQRVPHPASFTATTVIVNALGYGMQSATV